MNKAIPLAIAVLVLLAGFGVPAPLAEEDLLPPGRLIGEKVAVELLRWSTDAHGAKERTGSAGVVLTVGQRGHVYASTGFVGRDGSVIDPLCSNSTGTGGDPDRLLEESAHLWWADIEVLDATTQKIELTIDWTRRDRTPEGGSEQTREGNRVITLQEGRTHVIDFLERPAPAGEESRCGLNVLFEIKASIVEDPSLADTRLRYHVWIVDEQPNKPRQVDSSLVSGAQGESVDVEFIPFRWRAGQRTPDGKVVEVVAELEASLRGRLRPDGSIDLYLGATRELGVARLGQPRRSGVGGSGQRLVNMQPGETVELVMPTPQGSHSEWIEPSGPRERVTSEPGPDVAAVGENVIQVDFGSFFAEHTMSIFVTASIEDDVDG